MSAPSMLETKLHCYRFDVSTAEGKADYEKLCAKLKGLGLTCSESWGNGSHYLPKFGLVEMQTVQLETKHIFNNQWNTAPIKGVSDNGLRVFDWAQDHPMPKTCPQHIKQGH